MDDPNKKDGSPVIDARDTCAVHVADEGTIKLAANEYALIVSDDGVAKLMVPISALDRPPSTSLDVLGGILLALVMGGEITERLLHLVDLVYEVRDRMEAEASKNVH